MIPVTFDYRRVSDLGEAIAIISDDPDAKILAGGHSLVPAMKLRLAAPATLVDITGLAELRYVRVGDVIEIGALATYIDIADSDELFAVAPIFRIAIEHLGDQQVRARGTFGGSIAHADPAADLTAVLLALGGEVIVVGPGGERAIPVEEYFVDLWTTALAPDEVLTSIRIPRPANDARMTYRKHRHPASGYAVVGIAAIVNDGAPRVTITGATSRPEHLRGVEAAIAEGISPESIAASYAAATDGVQINGDLYADEEYRSHLVAEIVKQVLTDLS